ncbi:MAG: hypothetical protein WA814_00080 [Candidatus Baltobacteraceae bacterium]
MRRLLPLLSALVSAALLGGCGGAGTAPVVSNSTATAGAIARPGGVAQKPHTLGYRQTPAHPPKRRHVVTGADRARARAGGWQPVPGAAFPNGPGTALLMTDGTVMVQDVCSSAWYSLSPDQNGNYVSGTWTQKASLPSGYAPLYFASAVLADGKLIVNGGEYNFCNSKETNLGAIYDPVANTWTSVSPPSGWGQIGDGQSIVFDDGTYMIGNCCTNAQAILNESTMSWTPAGPGKHDVNSEEGWTLLRNGTLLDANVVAEPNSEIYNPSTNAWTSAGTIPVNLTQSEEIGPQTLRPNGTVFVAGASGHTAIYTKAGAWVQGPDFPMVSGQQLDVADGPSTVLTDGTVMVPASPGVYQAPAYFYIFNGKKFKAIANPPDAPNDSSYNIRLLMLPNGQVLETDGSNDVEIYTAGNRPDRKIAPVISSVPTTLTHGTTYQVSGKRFNGFTQGSMYGDDATQATNYPLVRIVNTTTGHVFYCRTHGHSFMGVGSQQAVSTNFDVPSTIETGASTLVVVANGIPSKPVSVTVQ